MAKGYRLQIIGPTGQVETAWPAGHPIEADLADAIVVAAKARGVGLLKTERQVEAAIRDAVAGAIYSLKLQVQPR